MGDFDDIEEWFIELARGQLQPVIGFFMEYLFPLLGLIFAIIAVMRFFRYQSMSGDSSFDVVNRNNLRSSIFGALFLSGSLSAVQGFVDLSSNTVFVTQYNSIRLTSQGVSGGITEWSDGVWVIFILAGVWAIFRAAFLFDAGMRGAPEALAQSLQVFIGAVLLINMETLFEYVGNTLNISL